MEFFQEALRIGQKAKAAGLGVGVASGKFQFQKITCDTKGMSTVIPLTEMMTMQDALIFDLSKV